MSDERTLKCGLGVKLQYFIDAFLIIVPFLNYDD